MIITLGNFYSIFITTIFHIETEGFSFTAQDEFKEKLSKLTNKDIETLLKLMSMEYFAFINNFMLPEFKVGLPVDFDTLKKRFTNDLKLTKKEVSLFDEINQKYDSGFHSRLLLKRLGYPKDADDLFVIQTLEEIKLLVFHQINGNLVKLLKIEEN